MNEATCIVYITKDAVACAYVRRHYYYFIPQERYLPCGVRVSGRVSQSGHRIGAKKT